MPDTSAPARWCTGWSVRPQGRQPRRATSEPPEQTMGEMVAATPEQRDAAPRARQADKRGVEDHEADQQRSAQQRQPGACHGGSAGSQPGTTCATPTARPRAASACRRRAADDRREVRAQAFSRDRSRRRAAGGVIRTAIMILAGVEREAVPGSQGRTTRETARQLAPERTALRRQRGECHAHVGTARPRCIRPRPQCVSDSGKPSRRCPR